MVMALGQRLAVARALHRGLDGGNGAFGIQATATKRGRRAGSRRLLVAEGFDEELGMVAVRGRRQLMHERLHYPRGRVGTRRAPRTAGNVEFLERLREA